MGNIILSYCWKVIENEYLSTRSTFYWKKKKKIPWNYHFGLTQKMDITNKETAGKISKVNIILFAIA
jgi:hypothetical protein